MSDKLQITWQRRLVELETIERIWRISEQMW
jgi:hypothetical protein